MAELVFGGGTSHSPMLNCSADEWARHIERDPELGFFDREGKQIGYAEVLAAADPRIAAEYMRPESFRERHARAQAALTRPARRLTA